MKTKEELIEEYKSARAEWRFCAFAECGYSYSAVSRAEDKIKAIKKEYTQNYGEFPEVEG